MKSEIERYKVIAFRFSREKKRKTYVARRKRRWYKSYLGSEYTCATGGTVIHKQWTVNYKIQCCVTELLKISVNIRVKREFVHVYLASPRCVRSRILIYMFRASQTLRFKVLQSISVIVNAPNFDSRKNVERHVDVGRVLIRWGDVIMRNARCSRGNLVKHYSN